MKSLKAMISPIQLEIMVVVALCAAQLPQVLPNSVAADACGTKYNLDPLWNMGIIPVGMPTTQTFEGNPA
ncbi:hypothetical protein IAE35_02295 [Pseudomonas sp. S75]|uniref:hypothetical protein n=1 Tax=unclassified Pseudomonas TaxID=196821 RepID=UPI001905D249|nr:MULTISPECIES: hypothetical protein [unclassified Pseudomonas]MBJ9973914.1 hypothetical protein [Pseudomonas sp. S30]MBK0152156.1 hypothetical protein [Pseudomonas sp. S75]